MNFKQIHLGKLIKNTVEERDIDIQRICNFMKCTEKEINQIYNSENLHTDTLLKWSKLLEYDFFRLYSQHLILYAPIGKNSIYPDRDKKISLPAFRKNIYTKEIIDYILYKIDSGKMTKSEIIKKYNIPKTTLYKWMNKYR